MFEIDSTTLKKALTLTGKFISPRATLPVLAAIWDKLEKEAEG